MQGGESRWCLLLLAAAQMAQQGFQVAFFPQGGKGVGKVVLGQLRIHARALALKVFLKTFQRRTQPCQRRGADTCQLAEALGLGFQVAEAGRGIAVAPLFAQVCQLFVDGTERGSISHCCPLPPRVSGRC